MTTRNGARTIYVASGNAGKLRDFAVAAGAGRSPWRIEPLPGLAAITPPPEEGETFRANACAKALYYGQFAPGSLVLADDSGLEVDALGGAPGVYSARYAERLGFTGPAGFASKPAPESGTAAVRMDERNNACLLAQLAPAPVLDGARPDRSARYRCVLALASDGEIVATAEGAVEGEILMAPRGTGGFGYDPLFFHTETGKTMAELDEQTRLSLSHRGAALRNLLNLLPASN